ncbi:hypothetical protein CARUB_v10025357mg, partial [Capsella rubella]
MRKLAYSIYRQYPHFKPRQFEEARRGDLERNLEELGGGRSVHSSLLFKVGLERDDHTNHSLVKLYAKCGEVDYARKVFDEIPDRGTVSWNSIISGYSEAGLEKDDLDLFKKMEDERFEPDERTLVGLSTFLGPTLISMYGKCGDLDSARRFFNQMIKKDRVTWNAMITIHPVKNEATWNAMITVYAHHGHAKEALLLFDRMSVPPSEVTFVGVLSACVHVRLLDQGCGIFHEMSSLYGLVPKEHYTNIIDLLSRGGLLEEAWKFMERYPGKPDETMLAAILGARHKRKDVGIAEKGTRMLMEMKEVKNAENFVISSKVVADMK